MFNFLSDMSALNGTNAGLDLDRSLPRFTILADNNYVLIVKG